MHLFSKLALVLIALSIQTTALPLVKRTIISSIATAIKDTWKSGAASMGRIGSGSRLGTQKPAIKPVPVVIGHPIGSGNAVPFKGTIAAAKIVETDAKYVPDVKKPATMYTGTALGAAAVGGIITGAVFE